MQVKMTSTNFDDMSIKAYNEQWTEEQTIIILKKLLKNICKLKFEHFNLQDESLINSLKNLHLISGDNIGFMLINGTYIYNFEDMETVPIRFFYAVIDALYHARLNK